MGFLPPVHDYIVCYAKNINNISDMGYPVSQEYISKTFSNPDNDPRGPWTTTDLSANHRGPYFSIVNPNTGEVHYPPKGRYWVFNENEVKKELKMGELFLEKLEMESRCKRFLLLIENFQKLKQIHGGTIKE